MKSAASFEGSDSARSGTLYGHCGVLIPAFDEARTIGSVVKTALKAKLGPVLVVDDGSNDDTAERAREAGASVLVLATNIGKGGAVAAGARALQTEVIVLIDADLTGLKSEHLVELAAPVLEGKVEMTRGTFLGGRWTTATAQRLAPQLNGQRAIRRQSLLNIDGLERSRYGLEIAITEYARRIGWRTSNVPLHGVSQVMKEEKRGLIKGFIDRLRMYRDIVTTLLGRA
ncbi:MAG: glycosyltransferase [Trueperaceae bacterium]|nr:MAG: glycosyltransferase [Trueperaceae bacterium]